MQGGTPGRPAITVAGHFAVAGSLVTAVSQAAVPKEEDADDDPQDVF